MKQIKIPIILSSLAFGTMSFLLPIYSHEVHMSAVEIGGLFSIFSLVVILIRPVIGKLADRSGYKILFVSGLLAYAVAFWVLADITNVGGLYTGRVIQALASSLVGASTYGIVTGHEAKNNVATSLGKITEWETQGSLIGCMICFFILTNASFMEGWKKLFMLYAIGVGVAMLISLVQVKPTTRIVKNECKKSLELTTQVKKFLLITFGIATLSSMLGPILMIYLQDYVTKDLGMLAIAFLPSTMIYSTLSSRLGKFSDKYGRIRGICIGLIISGSTILILPSTRTLIVLSVLWCIDAVGELISQTANDAFYYELIGENRLGEMYGIYRMVGGLGTVIGPLMGGVIYESVSGAFVFYLEGLGFIVIAVIIRVLFNVTKVEGGGKCIDENICERRL